MVQCIEQDWYNFLQLLDFHWEIPLKMLGIIKKILNKYFYLLLCVINEIIAALPENICFIVIISKFNVLSYNRLMLIDVDWCRSEK